MDLKEYREDAKRRGLKTTRTEDEGETMLRRLEHELILRKEMCEEKRALERELEELRGDVEAKRKVLGKNLESQLANLRRQPSTSEPFRRAFDLPYVETEAVETRVRLLPTPLYVAYAQLKHAQQNGEDAAGGDFGIDGRRAAAPFARRPTSEEERSPPKAARRRITAGIISVDEVRAVEDAVGAAVGRFPGCTRNTGMAELPRRRRSSLFRLPRQAQPRRRQL